MRKKVYIPFRCTRCKKSPSWFEGYCVELTGKKTKMGELTEQSDDVSRQYRCLDCGYVGRSRHLDLRRLQERGANLSQEAVQRLEAEREQVKKDLREKERKRKEREEGKINRQFPIKVRCSRCHTFPFYKAGYDLEFTGEEQTYANRRGRGAGKKRQKYQYRCHDCGHVGWSKKKPE